MNLYIQVQDGQPINHPAFEDNLLQAFGAIPENWEPFVRVECPMPTTYQILEMQEPIYQKVNNVWTDIWPLRDMTDAEKTAKQQEMKNAWATLPNRENFSAWTFDEETCQYLPPTPRPTEGDYRWDGETNSWKSLT